MPARVITVVAQKKEPCRCWKTVKEYKKGRLQITLYDKKCPNSNTAKKGAVKLKDHVSQMKHKSLKSNSVPKKKMVKCSKKVKGS